MLSNILDNALRAAGSASDDLKYMDMKMIERENVILLVCENGFDPSAEAARDINDIWHGIGLKNVEDIAERYNGAVDIQKDDSVYRISVLLKKRPFETGIRPSVTSGLYVKS